MSVPSSTIHILSNIKLTNDYKHTIWFESPSKQHNFFDSRKTVTFHNNSYIRKGSTIRLQCDIKQARTWTYLYVWNPQESKRYFYFINNIQYINESTVELFLELDVLQTYMFDFTLHKCFVEREHSASDEIGEHTLDEGLELGELVINQKTNIPMQEMVLLILSPGYPVGEESLGGQTHHIFNGVYSGLGVYAVESQNWSTLALDLQENTKFNESIVTMWMYPKNLISIDGEWNDENARIYKNVTGAQVMTTPSFARPAVLDGYADIKNKKLLTYPFNMMYVSNNAGTSAVYRYERFGDPTQCTMRVCGAISPEGSVKMYPVNYNGQIVQYEDGLMGGNYPTCAWNQDMYKLWLAQNQNQNALALGSAVAQIPVGIALGVASGGIGAAAGAGIVYNGLNSVMSILAQKADMQLQPPQSKGNFSTSVNVVAEHQTFTVMNKSVDAIHARIIDDFFSMYGYKCNLVKVPNIHVREHYTYTKTVGCHVSGNLCTEDLRKIESIFDNGITFWTNGNNICNYGESNNCLT